MTKADILDLQDYVSVLEYLVEQLPDLKYSLENLEITTKELREMKDHSDKILTYLRSL